MAGKYWKPEIFINDLINSSGYAQKNLFLLNIYRFNNYGNASHEKSNSAGDAYSNVHKLTAQWEDLLDDDTSALHEGGSEDASENISDIYTKYAESSDSLDSIQDNVKTELISSFRIKNFNIPKIGSQIQNLSYQNIEVPVVTPGTEIKKTLDVTISIDTYYLIYRQLKNLLNLNLNGEYIIGDRSLNELTITISSLYPTIKYKTSKEKDKEIITSDGVYECAYTWEFSGCFLQSIGNLTFNPEQSSTQDIIATFTYNFLKERNHLNNYYIK